MDQNSLSSKLTEETLNVLGNQIIAECWLLSFQAILDVFGPTEALEIIKPYMLLHGTTASPIWHRNFNIRGNDLADIAMGIQIVLDIHKIGYKNTEIKRDSAIFKIISCPYSSAPKEFCTSWCGYGFGGFTKGFNPQYEFFINHSLAKGDKYCQFTVAKINECLSDSETLVFFERPRLENEAKKYWAYAHLGELWTIYSNALAEHAGKEKAKEIMKPYMLENGMSFALSVQQRFNIIGNDAVTIGSIIDLSNEALQQHGQVLISSPKCFEKEITECPFSDSSHQICPDLLSTRSIGISAAINSDYEFALIKRMCKGDKVCHWVVKKRQ